ncbi:beta-ketoacyl-ACP synthase III [Arsenicicoccus sp. oral taxon 190]|uniref:beta-ketoacyl-ACP synthase III n=1 Tax=Arsenicicoccus sp. oral taxon 190 TaxID=1658671 RepID=UPI000679EA51|nr:beta-ketoacyl-ACP synthase III [Arsenicicoccus sp. oral taxon 190]AKT50440.1 3-oxoacyl-ACP synthase [Arsenicicoccus sp. oral taxon 190]
MPGSSVVAVGHYQPARVLDNHELARLVDTSDEWITRRVGIRERRVAAPQESVADMATAAALDALRSAGVDPGGVDLVLVATCTNHDRSPSTAAQVARRLGIASPAVMDVNAVCSGFCHALALADQAIAAGSATRAVVVGVDKFTDFVDWSDRATCILVGDGAGAVVVEASGTPTVGPVVWGSVPEMGDAVVIKELPEGFSQEGQSVFRWTTTALPQIARQICERAGLDPHDLGGIVLHQANLRIIEPLAAKIGATRAVVATDVVESGNTSAASVPLALSKLVRSGQVASGEPILLFGFGGGLAYAGQVIRCP